MDVDFWSFPEKRGPTPAKLRTREKVGGFFSPEAGQARREWLNGIDDRIAEGLRYYLGPSGVDQKVTAAAQGGQMLMDGADFQDAYTAGGDLMQSRSIPEAAANFLEFAAPAAAVMIPGVSNRMLQGAGDMAEDAARFVVDESGAFGGVFAKTADKDALRAAQDMLASGGDRGDIFRKTGWFKGVDGNWRFEIDDSGAVFKNAGDQTVSTLGDVLDHPELYRAYPEARNTDLAVMGLDEGTRGQFMHGASFNGRETPEFGAIALSNKTAAGPEGKSTLLHEIQHGIQRKEGFDYGSNGELGQYQARNYAAAIKSSPDARKARDDNWAWESLREEGLPLWRATTLDRFDNLTKRGSAGTLKPRDITRQSDWYEISRDYTAQNGPMPKKPGPQRDDWLHGAAIRIRQNYLDSLGATDRANLRYVQEEYPTPKDRQNAAARLDRKMDKVSPGAFEWGRIKERASEYADLGDNKYRSFEAYRRNSGEAEARNVQTRMDLTPEQRAAQLPWDTVDVPFEDQVPGTVKAGQALPQYMKSMNALTPPSPAQQVADLLASGRAADVTDEMLAKLTPNDNAELFKLYQSGATGPDMPMDVASRMQRAEAMGFDTGTPLYHGTGADFQAFVPSETGKFGPGVYTSPEASMAEKYMDMRDGGGKNVMQAFNRGERLRIDSEFTADQKKRLKLPKRVNSPDDLWPSGVTAEQFYSDLDRRAARGGYTAKEFGSPYQEVITSDPRNIRSRFARFDPRLSHLANLSAAGAGVAVINGQDDLTPEEQFRRMWWAQQPQKGNSQ